jgi:hypothetical protein
MTYPILPTAADFHACLTQPAKGAQTSRGFIQYAERG